MEPLEPGGGFVFEDEVKGGVIPREYIPAIQKGAKEATERGVLAGYPVVDVQVTVYDGSYHDVDSSEIAFKMAASFAFQDAARKGGLVLLEPVMKVEVLMPQEFMGDVVGDLNSRRGQIQEMTDRGSDIKVIRALVPLANMFGYATQLRSMTQGRGTYNMEFAHYAEVPANVAQTIVAGRQK